MKFITYSGVNQASVQSNLGQPEYSYYFVASGYRKVLESLGEVVEVNNPEEVDSIYHDSEEACVFLCFTPPHLAPVGLQCPTVCVFAWEFDTIPDEIWDENPKNDWRTVLANHGKTVTLATYSSSAVRRAMGDDYPVATIPVPVWNKFESARRLQGDTVPVKSGTLEFIGDITDTSRFSLASRQGLGGAIAEQEWDGEAFTLQFSDYDSEGVACLKGFYAAEEWGAWSRSANPFVELPQRVSGKVKVLLEGQGYHRNLGRDVSVTLGSGKSTVRFVHHPTEHHLEFDLMEPTSQLAFRDLETIPPVEAKDQRTLGIGLVSLTISRADDVEQEREAEEGDKESLDLEGVVYTSVFNPSDGRKNWIDMVTAFCHAHRDHADATLVLKMVANDPNQYQGTLRFLLSQLAPFDCRVVAIRGYLPDDQFEKLITLTSFYVNTSRCEGLCLPLMEYFSAGVPAIAPDHTAMADYVAETHAFVISSTVEQNVWPHDSRERFRALRYRLNWESIYAAFTDSYVMAKEDPDGYRAMSSAARQTLEVLTADAPIRELLQEFISP
jgi:glycosyltransferase involved in cell wall biosynthesis